MKTLKVMSIIGLVWFGLMFIAIIAYMDNDTAGVIGAGLWAVIYGIAFAIVGLVKSKQK